MRSSLSRIQQAKKLKSDGIRVPLDGDFHELEVEIHGVSREKIAIETERGLERIRVEERIPLKKWNDPRRADRRIEANLAVNRRLVDELILGKVWDREGELSAEERQQLLDYNDFVDEVSTMWGELLRSSYEDREDAEGNSAAGSGARSRSRSADESETKARKAS